MNVSDNAVHIALTTPHILRFTFKIWLRKRGGISGTLLADEFTSLPQASHVIPFPDANASPGLGG